MVRSFCVHLTEFFIQNNVTREWRVKLNMICEPFCFVWYIFQLFDSFENVEIV